MTPAKFDDNVAVNATDVDPEDTNRGSDCAVLVPTGKVNRSDAGLALN
jgi:hypothetical protein